jgi:uncharacterized protein (TIGR02271 family)
MTLHTNDHIEGWIGRTLVDAAGRPVGGIADIYADDDTGQPEWIAVRTGRSGPNISFVPIKGATAAGEDLQVPFTSNQLDGAPSVAADGHLTQEEEQRLYAHYGFDYGQTRSDSGLPEGSGRAAPGGTDRAMTRSEEELQVAKSTQEAGRVRLRKWVEVERVETTVPVAREEVRVEREPITDGNIDQAMSGPEITESEHEVVLHEEKAVASTTVQPKERIRLEKDVVADQQPVTADLRKERVEVVEGQTPRR